MIGLPHGWRALPIGDVLAKLPTGKVVQQGWSPQCDSAPAPHGDWGVLKTTAIQFGRFDDTQQKRLPDGMTPRLALEVAQGDLLLTNAGPRSRCAIPCLVRHSRSRLMLSGKIYRFRADAEILEPTFLELFLMSPSTQLALDKMKTGISDSGLNLTNSRFLTLPVVVPPLSQQRRIVDILEEHLSRLDAANVELDNAALRLSAWRSSLVDELIWQGQWHETSVGSLLSEPLRNGHSARASVDGAGIRTLTLTAVTLGRFEPRYTKMTVADPNRVSGLWLRPGDILVERSNTAELVGTTAYYDGADEWAIFPDLVIRVRIDGAIARPQFVSAAMSSGRAHRWLRSRAKGLAGSMPKIDQTTISSLAIPLPPLDYQDAALARLADGLIASARAAASVENARGRAAALRSALLQAAFSGQLTGRSSDSERAEEMIA